MNSKCAKSIKMTKTIVNVSGQWRTQKIFMGGFIQWHMCSFLFGVSCLSRHNLTSYSCFQTNVLAKFI